MQLQGLEFRTAEDSDLLKRSKQQLTRPARLQGENIPRSPLPVKAHACRRGQQRYESPDLSPGLPVVHAEQLASLCQ